MEEQKGNAVVHLVVDANAFLKNAKIEKIGCEIYSLQEIVSEIKDPQTKQRLQILPYDIIFTPPTSQAVKIVTEFSKKTGDYPSLSATDLKLIALTYDLEVRYKGKNHIKTEPVKIETEVIGSKRLTENPRNIIGFHNPKGETSETAEDEPESAIEGDDEKTDSGITEDRIVPDDAELHLPNNVEQLSLEALAHKHDHQCAQATTEQNSQESSKAEADSEYSSSNIDETSENEESSGEETDDEDSDWITPENYRDAVTKMGGDPDAFVSIPQPRSIPVACLTSDFAMQNVLLHMGLNVVSFDGMLVKRLRSYILRCHACFKTTSVMTKKFCPSCGNDTLRKVAVSVNPEDGKVQIHLSRRFQNTTRGLKYSLPMPKGGKHAFNPILCADQPIPQNRMGKRTAGGVDPLSPDYMARDSPFMVNDINSRSAVLGLRNLGGKNTRRKNPNQGTKGKKRGGKRN